MNWSETQGIVKWMAIEMILNCKQNTSEAQVKQRWNTGELQENCCWNAGVLQVKSVGEMQQEKC